MANEKQLSILRQGVETWNRWREEKPEVRVDLSEADLKQANLMGANLSEADLTETDLTWSELFGADLTRANPTGANLRGADLTGPHHVLIGLVMKGWINAFGRDGEPEFIPQPAMALRF